MEYRKFGLDFNVHSMSQSHRFTSVIVTTVTTDDNNSVTSVPEVEPSSTD